MSSTFLDPQMSPPEIQKRMSQTKLSLSAIKSQFIKHIDFSSAILREISEINWEVIFKKRKKLKYQMS